MKRWTTQNVIDEPATLTIAGHHESRRSPRTAFRIVMNKAVNEQGAGQVYHGTVAAHDGTTAATAKRVANHLAATGQLMPDVTIVA